MENKCTVIIPAYQPDEAMCSLIRALGDYDIVVVDDGSDASCAPFFSAAQDLGCTVLTHDVNRGKGRAIKTGLEYILRHGGGDVITVDADGQHLPADVDRVRGALQSGGGSHGLPLVIGSRLFEGKVPLRSRMGNTITRNVFHMATKNRVQDTQTGLRGFPAAALERLLTLEGDRYEFEIEMLLRARDLGLSIVEVPIRTVYINQNEASHFNTLKDSWRIYRRIFKYAMSSGACTLADIGVFSLLTAFKMPLLASVMIARVISVGLNYVINTFFVFSQKRAGRSLPQFLALAAAVMALNYLLTLALSRWMNVYLAKVLANLVLFFLSYFVQSLLIYSVRRRESDKESHSSDA